MRVAITAVLVLLADLSLARADDALSKGDALKAAIDICLRHRDPTVPGRYQAGWEDDCAAANNQYKDTLEVNRAKTETADRARMQSLKGLLK